MSKKVERWMGVKLAARGRVELDGLRLGWNTSLFDMDLHGRNVGLSALNEVG